MDHYLKAGSQAIHLQKRLACIGLQCVHWSQKLTSIDLGMYLCSPLFTDKMCLQSEKCQGQAWSKDALVFPFQVMYLVSACIWTIKTSNILHFWHLTAWLTGACTVLATGYLHL